jgi:hypothetical protein
LNGRLWDVWLSAIWGWPHAKLHSQWWAAINVSSWSLFRCWSEKERQYSQLFDTIEQETGPGQNIWCYIKSFWFHFPELFLPVANEFEQVCVWLSSFGQVRLQLSCQAFMRTKTSSYAKGKKHIAESHAVDNHKLLTHKQCNTVTVVVEACYTAIHARQSSSKSEELFSTETNWCSNAIIHSQCSTQPTHWHDYSHISALHSAGDT